MDDGEIPDDCRQFLLERDACAAVTLNHLLFLEAVPLRRVSFRFGRPRHAARFGNFFPGPVAFGQPENAYVVDAGWADRPLPQANEPTARLCEEQCRLLLDRRRARTPVSERVRDHLLRPGSLGDMAGVGASLGMAARTLHRHLAAEGTTFRQLSDEVRAALAVEMLSQRMRVSEVAERLGYAEVASFSHAFKRWNGRSPRSYREG